jgi:hypothetical protein
VVLATKGRLPPVRIPTRLGCLDVIWCAPSTPARDAWSPLGGGWLTGKYHRDERPAGATRLGEDPDRGVEAYDRRAAHERTWDVLDAVEKAARSRGLSMAQVALAWLVDRPSVAAVNLGARTRNSWRTTSARPVCTFRRRRPAISIRPATQAPPTTPTAESPSSSGHGYHRR